jgi:hypothetical protein
MCSDRAEQAKAPHISIDAIPGRSRAGIFIVAGAGNRKSVVASYVCMIRKLKSGQYRLYSRKKDAKSGRRKNLGTFSTRDAAEQHEREVQYFKRH